MNFRIDGKSFFLTYPHCTATRERALEAITQKLANFNPTNWAVAIEQHEDGTPHIHVLIVLDKKKSIHSAKFFDFDGFHGNYQTARNRQKVYEYVTKSDGECLDNFTPDVFGVKGKGMRENVGKRMLAGEQPEDLVEEYPQLLFGFKRLKEDVKAYEEAKIQYCALPTFLPNQWGFLITPNSKEKQRHLWIWSSSPNRGKTTWARDLESKYGAYIKSSDFTYWNVTGKEPIIILDDYNGAGLRYYSINQLCDGVFEARVFMGGVRRIQPKLVVVLSNQSLKDLYPIKYDTLYARFIEKNID